MVAKIRQFLEGAGFLNVAHNRLFSDDVMLCASTKQKTKVCFDGSVLKSLLTIHGEFNVLKLP